jgi:type I restriction enzyme, S subunit
MGGVSMEWKEVTLGDLCEISSSKRIFAKEYQSDGVPFYRGKEIIAKQKGNAISNELFISRNRYEEIKAKYGVPQQRELLLTSVGTLGVPYVIKEEEFYFKDGNLTWFRHFNGLDVEYLYYWFLSPYGKNEINTKAIGSTQKALTIDSLSKFDIKIPANLDDQRRIASILSSLDRKIELNNKINADLEEMAQAIFKNWFVDFEPFKDGKFVDSELGMIPEGWKVGSPYEYVKVVYGAPYKSAKFNDNGDGLPLIRIRDLKSCNPQFYTPEILPQTEYVNMGDIVAGMDAEFVPHIWKGNTGLLNQRVCKLMPQQTSISNLFVLYLMKPELEFVQSYKTGTTVSHLGKADIDKFVVVLPPLEVVEECRKILDSILQRIKNLSAESSRLSALRDTLLPRLMSGELEVPE